MTANLRVWCALLRAPGVGSKTYQTLLEAFGSPEAFFHAPTAEIRKRLPQYRAEQISIWQAAEHDVAANADMDWLAAGNGSRHIIPYDDPAYPPLLREIPDPPPLLFVQGNPALLTTAQIAIVGSRNASEPALRTCHAFAEAFAQAGLTVTSGLALGIDGAAHEGALSGGNTIAVVGTGLDRVYPARHRDLAHRIAAHGAIVSEYPIGTGVRAGNFPRRNRIISGLSLGVLVVEASAQSGSLITARLAAEQGREVFAIPGSIHNPLVKGCHRLIREGAKLIETAQDVLEELYPLALANLELQQKQPENAPEATVAAADTPEERLLQAMGYDPCRVDDLVPRLELTSAEISAMLIILELDGRVAALPGGMFQRVT